MDLLFATRNCLLILFLLPIHYCDFVKSPLHEAYQSDYSHEKRVKNFAKRHSIGIGDIQKRDVHPDHHGEIIQENPCKFQGSCEVNEVPGIIPVCYCDDVCSVYNDCCHDNKQLQKANVSVEANRLQYMTCETKILHTIFRSASGIFMVSKCPATAEYLYPNMSKLCLTANVLPVTSVDGETFKNFHCASCHGVQSYLIWSIALYYNGKQCSLEKISYSNLTYLEKIHHIREHCDSWFMPPKSTAFRFCVKSKDIDNSTNDNNLCLKFQNPISTHETTIENRKYYRNVHCNKFQNEPKTHCLNQQPYYITLDVKGYANIVLTGLFFARPINRLSEDECKTNEIKHSLSVGCDNCGKQSTEVCVGELLKNYEYRIEQNFVTSDVIDSSTVYRALTFIYMSWPLQTYGIYLEFIFCRYWCSENAQGSCCEFQGIISFTITTAMTHEQISTFITDISNMDWTYTEKHVDKNITISNIVNNSVQCPNTRALRYNPKTPYHLKKIINIFQKFSPISDLVPISVNGTINVIDDIDSNFVVENWKATYNENINTSLSNYTATGVTLNTNWGPKSILTYLTLGLSCLSLLVTMSVYQYFELFQHDAGKISRHMMLSLFIAQLFFVTAAGASFIYEVCFVIAVLSHYLWLCTFSWMSLFCIHVLHKMMTMRKSPGSLVMKEQLSYQMIFLGYIFPACFVVPCVLLDILTDIPIEYTGEICFISGYPANLIAFTVPVVISILTNITALITTSVLISRYNNTIKSLSTLNVTRSFIPLYIRSCVLCAFPWFLGILADIFYSDILDYVFIILAGSHGTFVSISFISTKTVTNKVRLLFQERSENSRTIEVNEMN